MEPELPSPHPRHTSSAPPVAQRRQLSPIYRQATGLALVSPSSAGELLLEVARLLRNDIEYFTAAPDIWHNTAILASKVGLDEEGFLLLQAGLHEWPDNMDLLCEILQEYYTPSSSQYSPTKAKQTWEYLEKLPLSITGPYWRFWVFGAIYQARIVYNPSRALELLDQGLRYVRRDQLMNLLRNYRAILIDSVPLHEIPDLKQLTDYQQKASQLVEERYKLGLRLGVESGYVLAHELAKLYQERAGVRVIAASQADQREVQAHVSEDLELALAYLKLAEALYTGDDNHPVVDIYQMRIHILMAQGKYGDALRLLQALPETERRDPSIAVMLRLATLSTGGKIDDDPRTSGQSDAADRVMSTDLNERRDELARQFIEDLFEPDGENLLALAKADNDIARVVVQVATRLTSGGGDE